jgi:hypothetical protein
MPEPSAGGAAGFSGSAGAAARGTMGFAALYAFGRWVVSRSSGAFGLARALLFAT